MNHCTSLWVKTVNLSIAGKCSGKLGILKLVFDNLTHKKNSVVFENVIFGW